LETEIRVEKSFGIIPMASPPLYSLVSDWDLFALFSLVRVSVRIVMGMVMVIVAAYVPAYAYVYVMQTLEDTVHPTSGRDR
jgi:hypothetical protein